METKSYFEVGMEIDLEKVNLYLAELRTYTKKEVIEMCKINDELKPYKRALIRNLTNEFAELLSFFFIHNGYLFLLYKVADRDNEFTMLRDNKSKPRNNWWSKLFR